VGNKDEYKTSHRGSKTEVNSFKWIYPSCCWPFY